jgi:hypothetical protein
MIPVTDKNELRKELQELDVWLTSSNGRETLIKSQEKAEETVTTIISDTTVDSSIMEIVFNI